MCRRAKTSCGTRSLQASKCMPMTARMSPRCLPTCADTRSTMRSSRRHAARSGSRHSQCMHACRAAALFASAPARCWQTDTSLPTPRGSCLQHPARTRLVCDLPSSLQQFWVVGPDHIERFRLLRSNCGVGAPTMLHGGPAVAHRHRLTTRLHLRVLGPPLHRCHDV